MVELDNIFNDSFQFEDSTKFTAEFNKKCIVGKK